MTHIVAICYVCKKDFDTDSSEPKTIVRCPHCNSELQIALTDRLFTRRHYTKG